MFKISTQYVLIFTFLTAFAAQHTQAFKPFTKREIEISAFGTCAVMVVWQYFKENSFFNRIKYYWDIDATVQYNKDKIKKYQDENKKLKDYKTKLKQAQDAKKLLVKNLNETQQKINTRDQEIRKLEPGYLQRFTIFLRSIWNWRISKKNPSKN